MVNSESVEEENPLLADRGKRVSPGGFLSFFGWAVLLGLSLGILVVSIQTHSSLSSSSSSSCPGSSLPSFPPSVLPFLGLTRHTSWEISSLTSLQFNTFHPQGVLRFSADLFFMTSVDVYDKSTGRGTAYLFSFNPHSGALISSLILANTTQIPGNQRYHPSGLDLDPRKNYLYLAVSEYIPDSSATVFRIEVDSSGILKKKNQRELFTVRDHIGTMTVFPERQVLLGSNWGSRKFYQWKVNAPYAGIKVTENDYYMIDFQDCKHLSSGNDNKEEERFMVCGGVAGYENNKFQLGGFAVVDTGGIVPHSVIEVPLTQKTASNVVISENTLTYSVEKGKLSLYFAPDNLKGVLYSVKPLL